MLLLLLLLLLLFLYLLFLFLLCCCCNCFVVVVLFYYLCYCCCFCIYCCYGCCCCCFLLLLSLTRSVMNEQLQSHPVEVGTNERDERTRGYEETEVTIRVLETIRREGGGCSDCFVHHEGDRCYNGQRKQREELQERPMRMDELHSNPTKLCNALNI